MLWWIANLVFLLVIVPVVIHVLMNTLQPIREIRAYADDITDHGGLFGPHLEAAADLAKTSALVKEINTGVIAYIAAIDKIR